MLPALLISLSYLPLESIRYGEVDGHPLTLNAFLPSPASRPTPAMIDIHGGWFVGGEPATNVPGFIADRGIAFFSIAYRLGDKGGFPECIRDCRNAVRFLRKNARRFNIDPRRIGVMGGSAGGFLSLMVAMTPSDFSDGGSLPGLKGVSPKVCGAFSWIAPTDLVQFWQQGPDDAVVHGDGSVTYRHWDDAIPNDARPHLRALFHGETPSSTQGGDQYRRMSPSMYVRRGLPPLLICDGEKDPIVPGTMGRELVDRLRTKGVDATYWLSSGGHDYPSGSGFDQVLSRFLDRIYR